MTTNPMMQLAQASDDWRTCDLTTAVTHDARRAVLDWFAAMLPGCVEGPVVPLCRALACTPCSFVKRNGQPHGRI
jgi:hypothetical protein